MGQCIGSPHYHQSSPDDEQPKKHFYKTKNGNLSATFHILDSDLHWDLLNVNMATEEQLMTLPGVNRTIARNIIDYRQAIGGFKKVEDLALVSGVGASKLEHFRAEICVNNRRKMLDSHSSSQNQSLESLLSIETNSRHQRTSPLKVVNINTANMFQLMTIRGMSQEMAANIIHYRERKGPFKNIDELLRVKSISPQKLSIMRLFIVIDNWMIKKENRSFSPSTPQINPMCKKWPYHRRTKSAPLYHSDIKKLRVLDDATREVYELLSNKCSRSVTENILVHSDNNKPSFRIGLWNLQCFSVEKAKNPGVQEVVCRTVLENRLSLLTVHEVTSDDALALICAELNDPQLKTVANWHENRGKWQYVIPPIIAPVDTQPVGKHSKMLSGFLFDTSYGLEFFNIPVTLSNEKLKECGNNNSIIIGKFKLKKLEFIVISVYCKQLSPFDKANSQSLPTVVESLQEQLSGEKNVLILGNVSSASSKKGEFPNPTHLDYSHLVPEGTSTNLNHKHQEDFILANQHMKKIYTGNWSVVREELSHLAIPNGWLWGGNVGDHCPLWVEFYEESTVISPLANGICQVPIIPEENCINSLIPQSNKEEGNKKKKWLDGWNRKRKRQDQADMTENGKSIFLN